MLNEETKLLHALVNRQKNQETEEDQETINEFEQKYSKFDREEILKALDTIIYDTANGNYSDKIEIILHSYEDFIDHLLDNMESNDFKRGFEFVFDKLPSDEQRKFIFWQYVRYDDRLFANNSSDYEGHKSRCLFWIVEVLEG